MMKAKDAVICGLSVTFMLASFGGLYYVVDTTSESKAKPSMTSPPFNEIPMSEQWSGSIGQPTLQIPAR